MMPKSRSLFRPLFRWGALLGPKRNRRIRLSSNGGDLLPFLGKRIWATIQWPGRLYLVGLVALLGGGGAYLTYHLVTHSRHFALRQIHCTPTTRVSCETLLERVEVATGTNLFSIDLDRVGQKVAQDPWVKRARARLELPSALNLDVVERDVRCAVALGGLYLVDVEGAVFKRAAPEELSGLAVVTGSDREEYLSNPEEAKDGLREVVSFLETWRRPGRPELGEVHLDRNAGITVYTVSGTGVRLGRVDEGLPSRLERFDAVWGALESSGEAARLIYLDNRARPDRVTVKLAHAPKRFTESSGEGSRESSGKRSGAGAAQALKRVAVAVTP
jgi:cell division protein FtsQ